ncbi:hypothetical protein TNCT_290501 [Trichonephila clavata]|uniref:Uncharacterized protein n=1 Tax=Trichonephila clavata TaxID=2740835 RepID=A0A8X6GMV8_TRICU|nr:hypothetical protein TNCT_290501 [Trichonephila clavata]
MPFVPRPDVCYDPLICHICKKKILPGEIRVRDHAHWGTGRINDLAHQVFDGVMKNLIQISSSEHADMRDEDPSYDGNLSAICFHMYSRTKLGKSFLS